MTIQAIFGDVFWFMFKSRWIYIIHQLLFLPGPQTLLESPPDDAMPDSVFVGAIENGESPAAWQGYVVSAGGQTYSFTRA